MNIFLACPDCHGYISTPAERDDYSGETWPIDDEVPEHGCEGAKPC
jgi:hypothetical protein